MNVHPSRPSDFVGPTNWAYSSYKRWIPRSPEVLKLIWDVYMRIARNYSHHHIYDVLILMLTSSRGQGCCNVRTFEGHSCEVMWIVDLCILWDHSLPFDHEDACIISIAHGGPRVEWQHCQVWWPHGKVRTWRRWPEEGAMYSYQSVFRWYMSL